MFMVKFKKKEENPKFFKIGSIISYYECVAEL